MPTGGDLGFPTRVNAFPDLGVHTVQAPDKHYGPAPSVFLSKEPNRKAAKFLWVVALANKTQVSSKDHPKGAQHAVVPYPQCCSYRA